MHGRPFSGRSDQRPTTWRIYSIGVKPSSQKPQHPICMFCTGDAAVRRRLQRFACAKLRNIGSPTDTNLLQIIFLRALRSSSRVCGWSFEEREGLEGREAEEGRHDIRAGGGDRRGGAAARNTASSVGRLGVAAQFELTLRQVDVIGTWEKLDQAEAVQASAVVERGRIWRSGLRFEDFAAGRLDVETSKTSTQAVYDVTAYPLFQQALAAVPASERMGPLVTDERGRPVTRRYYLALYRDVADAAGVPRAVWNMHARHGGATEAQEAGVALPDIAEHAQHTDINASTTLSRRSRRHVGSPSSVAHRQGKAGQSVKLPFPTAFPTRFPRDALSAWYSWVDSNHRPPDPQSAVFARHDATNPVTWPPRTPAVLRLLPSVRNCWRHGPTRPDAGLALPARYPNSVKLALPYFSLPVLEVGNQRRRTDLRGVTKDN
jgi:hypothetical protein